MVTWSIASQALQCSQIGVVIRQHVRYPVHIKENAMTAVTATDARRMIFRLIDQVTSNREAVEITSKRGSAMLISLEEYDSLQETAYLLRSPANAKRLLESLAQARKRKGKERKLVPCD
jgi:antitoxin YefM